MFHWHKKKLLENKSQVSSNLPVPLAQIQIDNAIMHCCCALTPKAFEALVKNTRLPFIVWYKALWFVQHSPEGVERVNTAKLAEEVGVSWPTAKNIKRKVTRLLLDENVGDVHGHRNE
jgi:hypothetical protein